MDTPTHMGFGFGVPLQLVGGWCCLPHPRNPLTHRTFSMHASTVHQAQAISDSPGVLKPGLGSSLSKVGHGLQPQDLELVTAAWPWVCEAGGSYLAVRPVQ